MKRFLAVLAFAAAAGAMYVAGATATSRVHAGPTWAQFSALKATTNKRLTSLNTQLVALRKDESAVKKLAFSEAGLLLDCMALAVPIDVFGDGQNQTEGYRYQQSDGTDVLTTALDVSTPDDSGALWITGGDATCADDILGIGGLRHLARLAGRHRHRDAHVRVFRTGRH